jgi:hypothetical protein
MSTGEFEEEGFDRWMDELNDGGPGMFVFVFVCVFVSITNPAPKRSPEAGWVQFPRCDCACSSRWTLAPRPFPRSARYRLLHASSDPKEHEHLGDPYGVPLTDTGCLMCHKGHHFKPVTRRREIVRQGRRASCFTYLYFLSGEYYLLTCLELSQSVPKS